MTPSTGPRNLHAPAYEERIMLRQYIHWRRYIGATVQIRQHGQIIRTGTQMMPWQTPQRSGSQATPPNNAPCTKPHGIEVWTEPEEAEDGLCYRMTSTAPSHN
ncbi:hypothetical protein QFZ79_002287 [Arthrobacter sp. V4I6]|uniref:hypothetical protein n=1 Tax=unclassified Arthrobacter TaxID=235627 RepID=UPI00277E982F|nr:MULTISPECIES: hypothetical protein [unclassified Arthrobacter]MDQ0819995.1 hypothetical protein [Arthrobacter sp. V1I7]MDQ0854176.1 hypothetical protein [Arthrobacter sp. V4I6]